MYTEKDGQGGVATLNTGPVSVLWRAPLVGTGNRVASLYTEHPSRLTILQPALRFSASFSSTVEWE